MGTREQRANEAKRIDRIGFRLAGIGGEFASNVVAGVIIGWGVDWYFEVKPWGIVGGAAAGLAVGTLQFIRHASQLNKQMGPVTPPPEGFREVALTEADERDGPSNPDGRDARDEKSGTSDAPRRGRP